MPVKPAMPIRMGTPMGRNIACPPLTPTPTPAVVARQTGLSLAVRSGGHSGAAHGLAVGFGDTGSLGYLSRKHGLTIDNLLAADVVTADGQVLRVDEHSHPDLFWAIRGGGGSFGVVMRLKFRLHPVDQVVGGMLFLPATAETVAGSIAAAEAAPDELTTIANVMPCPPMPFVPAELHGSLVIMGLLCFAGSADDDAAALAPLRALADPLADLVRPISYPEMFQPADPDYHPTAVSKTMLIDSVERDLAATIVDRLEATDGMRVVQLRVLGGAVARVPADATAYAHRSSRIVANVAAFYDGPQDRVVRAAWVAGMVARLDQGDTGAYVNFIGDEGPERVRAAYPGATWARPGAVKATYDPTNLFRRNQNVPPTGRFGGSGPILVGSLSGAAEERRAPASVRGALTAPRGATRTQPGRHPHRGRQHHRRTAGRSRTTTAPPATPRSPRSSSSSPGSRVWPVPEPEPKPVQWVPAQVRQVQVRVQPRVPEPAPVALLSRREGAHRGTRRGC